MTGQPWTKQNTVTLLQWIAAHNGREPGKADVLVWTAAAQTGRWDIDLANEAVTQFHLRESRLITPADVHQFVRSRIEDRHQRKELEEVKRSRPVHELVAADAAQRAIPAEDKASSLFSIGVDCPYCNAKDGECCTTRTSRGLRAMRPHDGRHEALRAAVRAAGFSVEDSSSEQCPTCGSPARTMCVNIVTGRYRMRGQHGEREDG